MTRVLDLIAWNLLLSALLALALWLCCRSALLRRRPALCHALWLLVLLKLITPPLVTVPLLPAPAAQNLVDARSGLLAEEDMLARRGNSPATNLDETFVERSQDATGTVARQGPGGPIAAKPHGFAWTEILVGLLAASLLVSAAIWFAALRQARQLRRLLLGGAVEVGRAVGLYEHASARFPVRCQPRLWVVDGPITPLLCGGWGGSVIVLPEQLLDSLSNEQLCGVLGHELAHYVRRDHWSNLFAFFVTSLCWWNPVAWLARHELAAAAETCCDTLAIERLAGSRKAYAQALLAVVDFVTAHKPLRPALATAFGPSPILRRRIEMLAQANVRPRISRLGWLFVLFACVALPLLPARAQEKASTTGATEATPAGETEGQPRQAEAGKQDAEAGRAAVAAQEPAITVEAVTAAWKKYQQHVSTAHFTWTETTLIRKGGWPLPAEEKDPTGPPKVAPDQDSTFEGSGTLLLDGKKYRYRMLSPVVVRDTTKMALQDTVGVSNNGISRSIMFPGPIFDEPIGSISVVQPEDIPRVILARATFQIFRSLSVGLFKPEEYVVAPERGQIDGHSCVLLQSRRDEYCWSLWVNPAHEMSIERIAFSVKDQLRSQVDVQYAANAEHGWVPTGWNIEQRNQNGNLELSVTAKVTEWSINAPIDSSEFDLKFPPGTRVRDFTKKSPTEGTLQYIQPEDEGKES